MKIRITATWEYEADPKHYPSPHPQDMLRVDLENYRDDAAKGGLDLEFEDNIQITGEVIQ